MTPDQLNTIKARLATATPGPWAVEDITSDHLHDICLAYTIPGAGNPILLASVYGDDDSSDPIGMPAANANAAFIAHAPADLAALLAYIGQLEGLLADLCEDGRAAAEAVRMRKAVSAVVALADKAEAAPDCPPQSLSAYRTAVCAINNALAPPTRGSHAQ